MLKLIKLIKIMILKNNDALKWPVRPLKFDFG